MTYPKVSLIILNWDGLEDTIECLECLKKITYSNYEVIVVDNGSRGNDAQVLKERFGNYIHLIENDRNYGFAEGANIGMRYALNNSAPDYILLLNNDTVVDPKFLAEMVEVAQADPAIGIAGAKIYYYDDPERLQFVWGKINLWTGQPFQKPKIIAEKIQNIEFDRGQYDRIEEVETGWVAGCCFLIKRQTLQKIGLLDKDYALYWEEPDYCLRAQKAGYRIIYVPQAKVWHKGGASTKKATETSRYHSVRSRFHFMKKHASTWQYRCFLIYFFGFYLWLATGYYLILHRNLNLLISFYRGARDGLFDSAASAKVYRRD